ncbi:hypothetical protein SteCoe_25402 [Stentor coeruleus]|uniref:Uncharacterized protein n=1 Tax=Stentor coeruleus TaxID=5963 RepID=A0A1R2BFL4_9CILI|nr:hypothetical protein SteCoe_25402 [Stentor coeruleus]
MIWLKLKLHMIPSISQEVDHVTQLYESLLNESSNKEKLKELLLLQVSIRGRIQEFEDLFEKNYENPLIVHFEKQKLRLRKLLQKEPIKLITPPSEPIKAPNPQKPITTDDYIKDVIQKNVKRSNTPPPATQAEWKELVFKIKLTKEEYGKLLNLKAKRNKIL